MLEQEHDTIHSGNSKNGTNSAFIRASEEDKNVRGKEASRDLTNQEIYGNMFILNLVGYDATANTMA